MKTLIEFSLRRRLSNPVALLLLGFTFLVSGALFFSDTWISSIAYDWVNPVEINAPEELAQFLGKQIEPGYVFVEAKEEAKIQIHFHDQLIQVYIHPTLSQYHAYQIEAWITQYHTFSEIQKYPASVQQEMIHVMTPEIEMTYLPPKKDDHSGFILITTMYFMMLSFSSAMANEIVVEKTSNMLELILTSVSFKSHYYAKMFIGWLSVILQTMSYVGIALFWLLIRQLFDQGRGLFQMLYQIQWLPVHFVSFKEWMVSLNLSSQWVTGLMVGFLFLFLGILVVQIIMVVISIRIEHIEEAGSVQGPFYLALLLIYYSSIFLNTPNQMNEGIGYILSFIPIFSMLFMPMRFLFYQASLVEVILSLSLSLGTWMIVVQWGEQYYRDHLIRGSKQTKCEKK